MKIFWVKLYNKSMGNSKERHEVEMNCNEAQRLINRFIKEELELEQKMEFLNHVKTCPECKEELEVYYILLIGMKQLDGESVFQTNLHGAFEEHLKKIEESYHKKKLRFVQKSVLFAFLLFFFVMVLSFDNSTGKDDDKVEESQTKTVSPQALQLD